MYAKQSPLKDVNKLRYQLFRDKKGEVGSSQLPPCSDCLKLHARRANYQACIWRRSLEAEPVIPSPADGHGWILEDGKLCVQWMKGLPAPQALLEFMSCSCSRECKLPKYECMQNSLKCREMCKLQTCSNMKCEDDELSGVIMDDSETDDDYDEAIE